MMEERKTRRTIKGIVVADRNDKTIVVSVETHKMHPKYGKRIKYRKKYYAHDENNQAKVGDTVTIMACRKLSATKRWRLVSIDKVHLESIKEAEAELEAKEEAEIEAAVEEKKAEEKAEEVKEEAKEAE